MHLRMEDTQASAYQSASQKIRVLTESWVQAWAYCPACGASVRKAPNNRPVLDFSCPNCGEGYELKSKKTSFGSKMVDGAYAKMIERLQAEDQPNFFLLKYSPTRLSVIDFLVIPKHFVLPDMIERRRPLSPGARRHGWVGCNILLDRIPQSGKIAYVNDERISPAAEVRDNWAKTLFLREKEFLPQKGWLLDMMVCIDRLGRQFSLAQMYGFADHLLTLHPGNRHVKEKIRQ